MVFCTCIIVYQLRLIFITIKNCLKVKPSTDKVKSGYCLEFTP